MKKTAATERGPSDQMIYLLLFAATLFFYSQVHNYAFLEVDDAQMLPGNPHVRDGFSLAGVAWAFTTGYAANWFPVTWLSHILDCQLFGLDAGWHHLTNVVIHSVNSVFLFALMKRMTDRLWESLFVAFVFALHPLHVESVAWVSERKDVLFAFFWFLTTWLYLDFLARRTTRNYLLMAGAFCLGLMSKQMIVTLPFALLLLDAWPLGRKDIRTQVLEKVPLVVLAILASAIAIVVQRNGGAVQSLDSMPFAARAGNALVSYIAYLANFVWPVGLSAFYKYPFHLPWWEVASAAAALLAISVLAAISFPRRPYLAVGWFWYLGTLLPVIGLIQVGYQSRADRYIYIPLIGISIAVAFGSPAALRKFAPVACSVWAVMTWMQIQYWQDGVTLHRHSIAVDDGNYRAHESLGVELAKRHDYPAALRELYTSVEQNPGQVHAHNSLSAVLFLSGRKQEAIEEYRRAIGLDPLGADLHINLGNALAEVGQTDDAIRELQTAVRLNPAMAGAYFGLGRVMIMQERHKEAVPFLVEALRIDPGLTAAREQLEALRGAQ